VCYDCDHDSLPEITFWTGTIYPSDPRRLEFWEHQGWNRFALVYADTGAYPEPNGITTGNAFPWSAGDADGDGLTDIACSNYEFFPDSIRDILMLLESPDAHSYPRSLTWHFRGRNYSQSGEAYITPDLDRDGRNEVIGGVDETGCHVWESVGDNQYEDRWFGQVGGATLAFRDFDCDGRSDIGTSTINVGPEVWEGTGDDHYEKVWMDTSQLPAGYDAFSTSDIDGDGRPELYVCYEWFSPRSVMWLYLYEAESEGSHVFKGTFIDSLRFNGVSDWGHYSAGGDIDGDGIEECIWTTVDSVRVYRAFGDNDLRKVWDWRNDHHDTSGFNSLTTTVYDVNGDGYNELLLGGNSKISVFEVDAVDLLAPNGGSCSVGDTVPIRWAVNTPPRCDSLSLFLRRDSLWNLSTIATGLPGTDTAYRWVVPARVPETARVVVIAYGPGWQFDISDSAITFIGGGVAEGTQRVPLRWSLSVSPNPALGPFTVRYDVPRQSQVSIGIYDANGRLVRSLHKGDAAPGRYEARLQSALLPAGVYFCRLRAGATTESKRVTLIK